MSFSSNRRSTSRIRPSKAFVVVTGSSCNLSGEGGGVGDLGGDSMFDGGRIGLLSGLLYGSAEHKIVASRALYFLALLFGVDATIFVLRLLAIVYLVLSNVTVRMKW